MTEFMKKYKLKITVLSPVHIGAATDLEPTEYVIYSEKGEAELSQKQADSAVICPECGYKNPTNAELCGNCGTELSRQATPVRQTTAQAAADSYLYTFTPGQLSTALSEQPQYKNAFRNLVRREDRNALRELLDFFRKNAAPIAACATKRAKVRTGFVQEYNKILEPNGRYWDLWKLTVEALISDPVTGYPYIPGTEIKGAIRTALMSAKNRASKLNRQDYINNKNNNAEGRLYNYRNVDSDPFKALKLCDATADEKTISAEIAALERKVPERTIIGYVEVISENSSFVSSLSLWQGTSFDETIDTIQCACTKFYLDILKEENKRKWDGRSDSFVNTVENKAKAKNAFILNLGKHGGAESKTIDGLRIIKNIPSKQTSDTYCKIVDGNEIKSFGWCVVEFEEEK